MGSIVLRDYQDRDADRLRESYRRGHKAPLYVAPCGAGKTVLFAYICDGAVKRGIPVLLLCHRVELIQQISDALAARGINHGFIASGRPLVRGHSVYVASVFTMCRRLDFFHPGLIIIDEAHHTGADTWDSILRANASALRLGVTATPVGNLAKYFDDIIIGPTYKELTDAGFLTPLRVYAPPSIDTNGLRTRGGEFIPVETRARSDKPSVTGNAIDHYKDHIPGRRAIVFDVCVDSAIKRAESFRHAGIPSECIDGKLDRSVRNDRINGFREGSIFVLTSVDLVEEGFDLPAIEAGIDLCPTQSLRRFMQRAGRLIRSMEGKTEAYLFDHAGNCLRHGFPTEDREWKLEAGARGAAKKDPNSVRICQSCFAANRAGARVCSACRLEFPVEGRTVAAKKGDLKELTPDEARAAWQAKIQRNNQGRAQTVEALVDLYYIRHGRSDPGKAERWAQHILAARRKTGR